MITSEIYFHTPYKILLENLSYATLERINCEIYVDGPALDDYKEKEIREINGVFKENSIKKIVHGPFMDLNAGSYDAEIRKLTQRRYLQALDFCKKIDGRNIVLHTGFHPIFYKHHKEDWLKNSAKTLQPVIKKALKCKVRICVENSIDDSPEMPISLIEEIGSMDVLACFDVAHYNVFTKMPILDCLAKYPPGSIGEIHLSDNKGDFDSHLALGEGNINFKEFFAKIKELKINPIITVEPHKIQDIPKIISYLESI